MRIRSYLATVILCCLIGGSLIELVVSRQYDEVQQLSDQYNEAMLWQKDFDRLTADTSQYLVSVDLILGSGETYLTQGALDKGHLLTESLSILEQRVMPAEFSSVLSQSKATVSIINSFLNQAAVIEDNREQQLYELLLRSDVVTEGMVQQLMVLSDKIQASITRRASNLEIERKKTQTIQTLSRLAFFFAIVLLWLWANRQISKPLRALSEMARVAETGVPFEGVDRGPQEIIALSKNTQRLTRSLSYQATHDALTGLFSRREFERLLAQQIALQHDVKGGKPSVLCYIDLDHFKVVNDTCGHAAGDELLAQVARLLQAGVRTSDTVARLGGDEFAILLAGCDLPTALEVCNKIRNTIMDVRYQWDDEVYRISASMGITEINNHSAALEDVVNAADTACKVAKDAGRDRVHVFEVGDDVLAQKRTEMLWVNQLNNAIDENRFELHRQFIVPLQSGIDDCPCYEILLRLKSSEGNLIFPNEFLHVAERYHLGARLDRWVVNAVIDWLIANPRELEALGVCSINLSGQSMASKDLLEFIVEKISSTKFPAKKICFEITETAVITDIDNARQFIEDLRFLGCRFALDDFGSGLSSFGYLKTLDVDVIKIDGIFVKDMLTDPVNLATVKSITEVAKALNKKLVAEFVETEAIANELKAIGVDYAQGYHFSKPHALSVDN